MGSLQSRIVVEVTQSEAQNGMLLKKYIKCVYEGDRVFWVGSCVKVLLVNKVCTSLLVGVCITASR